MSTLINFFSDPPLQTLLVSLAAIATLIALAITCATPLGQRYSRWHCLRTSLFRWKEDERDRLLHEQQARGLAVRGHGYRDAPVKVLANSPIAFLDHSEDKSSSRRHPGALPNHALDLLKVNGKVLLLGQSGIGKTTTLLNIAIEACQRHDYTIPVWLDVSTTVRGGESLTTNRIVAEVNAKLAGALQDVPAGQVSDAKKKLEILLIIDALDEYDRPHEAVSAINGVMAQLAEQQISPERYRLAVACRTSRYYQSIRQAELTNVMRFSLLPLAPQECKRLLAQNLAAADLTESYVEVIYDDAIERGEYMAEVLGNPLLNALFSMALLGTNVPHFPPSPHDVVGPTSNYELYRSALEELIRQDYEHKAPLRKNREALSTAAAIDPICADIFALCRDIADVAGERPPYTEERIHQVIAAILDRNELRCAWTVQRAYDHLTILQLLIHRDRHNVKFFHDSVCEFFMADSLRRKKDGRSSVLNMASDRRQWDTIAFYAASLDAEEAERTFLRELLKISPDACLYLLKRTRNRYGDVEAECARELLARASKATIERKTAVVEQLLSSHLDCCQQEVAKLYGDTSVDPDLKYAATASMSHLTSLKALHILRGFMDTPHLAGRWEALYPILRLASLADAGTTTNPLASEARRVYREWHMRVSAEVGVFARYYRLARWGRWCFGAGWLVERLLDSFRRSLGDHAITAYSRQDKGDICLPVTDSRFWRWVDLGEFRAFRAYAEKADSADPAFAIMCMTYLRIQEVLEFAVELIGDECPEHLKRYQFSAAFVLAHIKSPRASRALYEYLRSHEGPEGYYGVWGLAHQLDPAMVPLLTEYIKDRKRPHRQTLLRYVGRYVRDSDDQAAIDGIGELLRDMVTDQKPAMRWAALQSMKDSCQRYDSFLPYFVRALADSDEDVREQAASLLLATDSKALRERLLPLVEVRADSEAFAVEIMGFRGGVAARGIDDACAKPERYGQILWIES